MSRTFEDIWFNVARTRATGKLRILMPLEIALRTRGCLTDTCTPLSNSGRTLGILKPTANLLNFLGDSVGFLAEMRPFCPVSLVNVSTIRDTRDWSHMFLCLRGTVTNIPWQDFLGPRHTRTALGQCVILFAHEHGASFEPHPERLETPGLLVRGKESHLAKLMPVSPLHFLASPE